MKSVIALVVGILLATTGTQAVAGPKNVTLPPYKEHELENGIRLFVMQTTEVPLVTVRLMIPVGSAHDPSGEEGIANLTARLLMKGAAGMSADEIAGTIEGVGGELEVYATKDYTVVYGDFMKRDLEMALELMSKIVTDPDFAMEELDREKSIIDSELQGQKERPSRLATREFTRALAGGHPYGRPVEGSRESVARITRDQVAAFHERAYVPRGSLFAIVGDVDPKRAVKMVKKLFGGWEGAPPEAAGVAMLTEQRFPGRKVIVIDKPDATQSQIRIGNIAVPMNNPYFFQLEVANSILGGGFTSRLMDEIRVNRGLSYGARSSLVQLRKGGAFAVSTFTKNATLRETIDVALEQVGRMRSERVGDQELENAQNYISGLFPFELETNSQLANWLTRLSFYGFERDFVERYRERIDQVTSDEVMDVAQKYFRTDDCLILLLTNYAEVKDQLEGLGEIEVVGIDDIE